MLPASSISNAANKLRMVLQSNIDDITKFDQIKIGHPRLTLGDMPDDQNHLNLFFYNIQYDGYPSEGLSENPFYVRLYCLITAVGAKEGIPGTPSAGENDLRLIGEVMRILHENPVISVENEEHKVIAQLQIVPYPLTLDNLNHIWSTQGDTAYRLSVAYEIALAPIPLAQAIEKSKLVGEIGTEVQGNMDYKPLPEEGFKFDTFRPVVPKITVDFKRPDWLPHICFINQQEKKLDYTLLKNKSELSPPNILMFQILIAGNPTSRVYLVWELWNPEIGWKEIEQLPDKLKYKEVTTATIDQENISSYDPLDIRLNILKNRQFTLYAERVWQRPDGSSVKLRSNPLLVTIYEN